MDLKNKLITIIPIQIKIIRYNILYVILLQFSLKFL